MRLRDEDLVEEIAENANNAAAELLQTLGNRRAPFNAGFLLTLAVQDVDYCFRWIPPGCFNMGSLPVEKERRLNEKYHRVELTRVFFMLDTPVTQRMYSTVMNDNPSCFVNLDNCPTFGISRRKRKLGRRAGLFEQARQTL